jgi:hypothetical protein
MARVLAVNVGSSVASVLALKTEVDAYHLILIQLLALLLTPLEPESVNLVCTTKCCAEGS